MIGVEAHNVKTWFQNRRSKGNKKMKSAGLQGREEGNASEEAMEGGAEINSVDNAGPVPLKHSIERIIHLQHNFEEKGLATEEVKNRRKKRVEKMDKTKMREAGEEERMKDDSGVHGQPKLMLELSTTQGPIARQFWSLFGLHAGLSNTLDIRYH